MSHRGTEEIGSAAPLAAGLALPVPAHWVVPLLRVREALHIPFLGMCRGLPHHAVISTCLAGFTEESRGGEHPGAREGGVPMVWVCWAGMLWEDRL